MCRPEYAMLADTGLHHHSAIGEPQAKLIMPANTISARYPTPIFAIAFLAALLLPNAFAQSIDPVVDSLMEATGRPLPGPFLIAPPIREATPLHEVKLVLPWWIEIEEGSIGDGDLTVKGPNGYESDALFVSMIRRQWPTYDPAFESLGISQNNPKRASLQEALVVTYKFLPPNGEQWTSEDNGRYKVKLGQKQIGTESGRYLPPRFLKAFFCIISPGSNFPIQPAAVRCAVKPYRSFDSFEDRAPELPPIKRRAIVYAYFRTPFVNIEWGTVRREKNTFYAEAIASRYPIAVSNMEPIAVPLAGSFESTIMPDPENLTNFDPRPSNPQYTLPVFRYGYDLGELPEGEYKFIFLVNGIEECSDNFVVPADPIIDITPPRASFAARDITKASFESQTMLVTYQDRSGVDVTTIGDGDFVVFNPHIYTENPSSDIHDWHAQRARLVRIVSISPQAREVKALYEIEAPRGGWSERHNGIYTAVLWENAICDRLGNCVDRQRIGAFAVDIDDEDKPIPAKAKIRVDTSDPDNVVANVHIKFRENWRVVDQKIRRLGNRIYLIATAEPGIATQDLESSVHPQQNLLYEIGPLEAGHYGIAFVMNGHVYDTNRFRIKRPPPIPAKVEFEIDTSNPEVAVAKVTIQFETPHVVAQGEPRQVGHRVILPANAKPLSITDNATGNTVTPNPIHLQYEIKDLEPGGYLGLFVMNDTIYAAEAFRIGEPEPPIPAKARIDVDSSDPENTLLTVTIAFESPHEIIVSDIHRCGNRFFIEAKAQAIATIDAFAPIPLPQIVELEFSLGALDEGEYHALFAMNAWPYARTSWTEPESPFEADVEIEVEKTDTGAWQAKATILFQNPWVQITDPGDVVFDGHVLRINASAELPEVVPAIVIDPSPIVIVYDLGELEAGGYWLKYYINRNLEKQRDFYVPPPFPIPAEVDIVVDTTEQPIVATASIQFEDHYRITAHHARRFGNLFLLNATAEGPLPLLAPIPPPPVELDYELGELAEGTYFATFRMNGHFYDFVVFEVEDSIGFEAEVELEIDVDETVSVTAVVDIDDPFVIVTDPGEPEFHGNIIRINATAERVVFIAPPSGDPQTFTYDLGEMETGWYHLVYYINGTPEARAQFFVPDPPEAPIAKISHIKISQGDASWFARVGVILWPGQAVSDWGVIRQEDATFHVNITVDWIDFPWTPHPWALADASLLPDQITVDHKGQARIGHLPVRIVTHDYALGVLEPGEYEFVIHSRDYVVARKAFEVPGSAPEVQLLVEAIVEATESHGFRISFSDPDGLDHESIRNADVWVANFNGNVLRANLIEYASTDDDPSTGGLGIYSVIGPDGSWDHSDNGRYCVYVNPEAIRDLNGNHIKRSRLGCFRVHILPEPPDTGVKVTVELNEDGDWEALVEIVSNPGEQVVVDSWGRIIHHGHSIVTLASVHIEETDPVEPLAHSYNLGALPPGYYIFVFKTNLAHCGIARFIVPGLEGDPFDSWQERVGVTSSGEEQDIDRDGNNLLGEYFFGTNPGRQDASFARPEIVYTEDGVPHLGMRFRRVQGAEGLIQQFQGMSAERGWEDISQSVEVIDRIVFIDGTEELLVCLNQPLHESEIHFMRLRVMRDSQ